MKIVIHKTPGLRPNRTVLTLLRIDTLYTPNEPTQASSKKCVSATAKVSDSARQTRPTFPPSQSLPRRPRVAPLSLPDPHPSSALNFRFRWRRNGKRPPRASLAFPSRTLPLAIGTTVTKPPRGHVPCQRNFCVCRKTAD